MYKLTKHNTIIRLADNASILADPANTDYQEYLEWLAAGNTPQPAQTAAEIGMSQYVTISAIIPAGTTYVLAGTLGTVRELR